MEVIVVDAKNCLIDGTNCGNVADAIANMPQFASKIQFALEKAWADKNTNQPQAS